MGWFNLTFITDCAPYLRITSHVLSMKVTRLQVTPVLRSSSLWYLFRSSSGGVLRKDTLMVSSILLLLGDSWSNLSKSLLRWSIARLIGSTGDKLAGASFVGDMKDDGVISNIFPSTSPSSSSLNWYSSKSLYNAPRSNPPDFSPFPLHHPDPPGRHHWDLVLVQVPMGLVAYPCPSPAAPVLSDSLRDKITRHSPGTLPTHRHMAPDHRSFCT